MSTFKLKLFACIFMLIDHIGAVLFPQYIFLRVIGRLAFPLFAYLIATGYKHTKNLKKYFIRLFCFALISQLPFEFAFNEHFSSELNLNIFFTLFLGLAAIYLYEKFNKKFFPVIFLGIIAQYAGTDYGLYGVFTIFFFYKYLDSFKNIVISQVIINIFYTILLILSIKSGYTVESIFSPILYIQNLSLLSLIFINFYNNQKGMSLKYSFYIFYPLHLTILYFLK